MYVTQSIISRLRKLPPKADCNFHSISIWNKISAAVLAAYADALQCNAKPPRRGLFRLMLVDSKQIVSRTML
jgi:hypothetical protein